MHIKCKEKYLFIMTEFDFRNSRMIQNMQKYLIVSHKDQKSPNHDNRCRKWDGRRTSPQDKSPEKYNCTKRA